MRLALAACVLLSCSAGQDPVFCTTPCGMNIAAENRTPLWSCDDYSALESALVARTTLPVCITNRGATAWELPGFSTVVGGVTAAGWTECGNRRVLFHTGDGFKLPNHDPRFLRRGPEDSALAHELLHLAQKCSAPLPVDPGQDVAHANWQRAGLFDLVETLNREAASWKP